jgi:serine/threonine protein kinase
MIAQRVSDAIPAPIAPSWLGRYHCLAALAQGGMAKVYLAATCGPRDFTKLVVIKEMREELAREPEFVTMFTDEARLAARLNHPNVVQTYEVGCDGERHFLAMEYLEGVAYWKLARLGAAVPLAVHLRVLVDALVGLHYAHELTDFDGTPLHVVHRDVSPQNVLVTYRGDIKLVDFGIAKGTLATPDSRPGMCNGKLSYMAPEQARGGNIDRRADVFAVGIMLWEALTSKRLWERSEKHVLHQLMFDEVPDVRALLPSVPAELARICARALARDPDARYATAAEMEEDLEAFARASGNAMSAREVGRFVATKFTKERARMSAAIGTQVARLGSRSLASDDVTQTLTASLQAPPIEPSTASHASHASPASDHPLASCIRAVDRDDAAAPWWSPTLETPHAPRRARPKRRTAVVILACAIFIAATAAGLGAVVSWTAERPAKALTASIAPLLVVEGPTATSIADAPVEAPVPASLPEPSSKAAPPRAPTKPLERATSAPMARRPATPKPETKPLIDFENPYR